MLFSVFSYMFVYLRIKGGDSAFAYKPDDWDPHVRRDPAPPSYHTQTHTSFLNWKAIFILCSVISSILSNTENKLFWDKFGVLFCFFTLFVFVWGVLISVHVFEEVWGHPGSSLSTFLFSVCFLRNFTFSPLFLSSLQLLPTGCLQKLNLRRIYFVLIE